MRCDNFCHKSGDLFAARRPLSFRQSPTKTRNQFELPQMKLIVWYDVTHDVARVIVSGQTLRILKLPNAEDVGGERSRTHVRPHYNDSRHVHRPIVRAPDPASILLLTLNYCDRDVRH